MINPPVVEGLIADYNEIFVCAAVPGTLVYVSHIKVLPSMCQKSFLVQRRSGRIVWHETKDLYLTH